MRGLHAGFIRRSWWSCARPKSLRGNP